MTRRREGARVVIHRLRRPEEARPSRRVRRYLIADRRQRDIGPGVAEALRADVLRQLAWTEAHDA